MGWDIGVLCGRICNPRLAAGTAKGEQLGDRTMKWTDVAFMVAGTMVSLSRATSEPQPTLRDWITKLEARKAMFLRATR